MRKFLPYILILITLVGFFGSVASVHASETNPEEACVYPADNKSLQATNQPCGKILTTTAGGPKESALYQNLKDCDALMSGDVGGCIEKVFYFIFYGIPAFLLYLSAMFFNAIIAIALKGTLFSGSSFLSQAWGIVRDLSNIFFIIVLLYISIQMILGIGGHNTKKMIANVIIMALLINFSMFFTNVIIDSSNVLALVFYNKLNVNTKQASVQSADTPAADNPIRPYIEVTPFHDVDIAGAMVNSFDPSQLLKQPFFDELKKKSTVVPAPTSVEALREFQASAAGRGLTVVAAIFTGGLSLPAQGSANQALNYFYPQEEIPISIILAIIVISGAIMFYAAYCFFLAGFAFLARIIELWMLIIFSPFAFMSASVPFLEKFEDIGWHAWISRVIKLSFMAPIFMFFMYLIFMLINSSVFGSLIRPDTANRTVMATLLFILLPALFILILLKKATEFAKKASGKFGEVMDGLTKVGGGLALGVATGGAAVLGAGTIGQLASKVASSEGLKEATKEKGLKGWTARRVIEAADYGRKASFDVRNTGAGRKFGKVSGMNLASNALGMGIKEGGYKGMADRKEKELERESEFFKTGMSNDEVKKWSIKKMADWEAGGRKGPAPKDYSKSVHAADELNHDRMKAFQDNLGLEGILGSLAYNLASKVNKRNYEDSSQYQKHIAEDPEYYKDKFKGMEGEDLKDLIANDVNKERARTVKMVIGGTLAAAAGAATGGVLGGAGLGAFGAGIGAAGAQAYSAKETAGEKQFSKAQDKESKQVELMNQRMEANTKALDKLHETLESRMKEEAGLAEKDRLVSGNRQEGFSINSDKLADEIAKLKFIEQKQALELKKLVDQGRAQDHPDMQKAQEEFRSTSKQMAEFKKLETAEKEQREFKKQIHEVGQARKSFEAEHKNIALSTRDKAEETANKELATGPEREQYVQTKEEEESGHGIAPTTPK